MSLTYVPGPDEKGIHTVKVRDGEYFFIPYGRENLIGQNFEVELGGLVEVEGAINIILR